MTVEGIKKIKTGVKVECRLVPFGLHVRLVSFSYGVKINRIDFEGLRSSEVIPYGFRKGKKVIFERVRADENSQKGLRSLPSTEGTMSFEIYLSETNKSKPTRRK